MLGLEVEESLNKACPGVTTGVFVLCSLAVCLLFATTACCISFGQLFSVLWQHVDSPQPANPLAGGSGAW